MSEGEEEQDVTGGIEPAPEQNTAMDDGTDVDRQTDSPGGPTESPSEMTEPLSGDSSPVEQTDTNQDWPPEQAQANPNPNPEPRPGEQSDGGSQELMNVEQTEVGHEEFVQMERTEAGQEEFVQMGQMEIGQGDVEPMEGTETEHGDFMPGEQTEIDQGQFAPEEQTELGQEEFVPTEQMEVGQGGNMAIEQTEGGYEESMPSQETDEFQEESTPVQPIAEFQEDLMLSGARQVGQENFPAGEPPDVQEEIDDDWFEVGLRPEPLNAITHGVIRDSCPHTPRSDGLPAGAVDEEGNRIEAGEEAFIRSLRDDVTPSYNANVVSGDDGETEEDKAAKDLLLVKAINARYLPAFANEENVILNDTVLELELAFKKAEEAVEEQDDRAAIMEEHMKRVQQEIYFSQSRHEAKRREIATEYHLCKIAEFEDSRLKGEMRKMIKETDDINERLHAFRTQIFKANERMDQFRLLMHWNQEELEQWARAARQKQDDLNAMDKYTKSDDVRIRELQLEEARASEEVYRLKQALDAEVTETQSYQIQLDKTAILFREMHLQRQKVIRLWETTVEAIHKRDESIHSVAEEFADNKLRLQKKKHQLDALQKVMLREMDTNKDLERMIVDAEGEVVKVREVALKEAASMNAVIEVYELQKVNHMRAQGELAALIAMKAQAEEEVEIKIRKIAAAKKRLQHAKDRVQEEHNTLDTLEERSNELERVLDKEEENLKTAKKEVVELREKHFKATEELHVLKAAEKDSLFEIEAGRSQIKSLGHKLHALEMSLRRQDEVIYTLDFQIQALERKVGRAMGERTDLETKEIEKKIEDLEKRLEDKRAEEALVISQLKKTNEELRASTRKNEEVQKKLAIVTEKNSELTLECETGMLTLKALQKQKEETMLDHDLLQMEVNRLSDILNAKADGVFTMESIKKKLIMSMDDQKREINARQEATKAQLKILNDELHKLMVQRKSMALQIEKLQAKYQTLVDRVKMEDGKERSANYYIVKAAQERQLLELEIPKLEGELEKVQADVEQLEKANAEIKESNNALRTSLNSPKSFELAHEQMRLKLLYEDARERVRVKQREEAALMKEIRETEERLATLQRERATVNEIVEDLERKMEALHREADDQAIKHRRAAIQLQKVGREVKETMAIDEAARIDKELQLAELRENVKDVLYKLKCIAMENIDTSQIIHDRVAEAGLKFPSTVPSARSSRSGSSTSSTSSRSTPKPGPSTKRPLAGSILSMDLGLDDL